MSSVEVPAGRGDDPPGRLRDVAKSIKSANAGASQLTFDIFFETTEDFAAWERRITPAFIAQLYDVDEALVSVYPIDTLRAVKVTIPRGSVQGSLDERDFDGVQQHIRLLEVTL